MSKSVTVIGLGPSLLKNNFGPTIDKQEYVVRTTVSSRYFGRFSSENYGTKADYIVVTPQKVLHLWEHGVVFDFKECWFYLTEPDIYGGKDCLAEMRKKYDRYVRRSEAEFTVINPYIQPALDWYKENYDSEHTVGFPTKGTAAILGALRILNPKVLYLLGFDWTARPETTLKRKEKPGKVLHDIQCERKLLDYISNRRGIELVWVGQDENSVSRFLNSA